MHPLEVPYLAARSPYPTPDPTVGGAIAFLSRFDAGDAPPICARICSFCPKMAACLFWKIGAGFSRQDTRPVTFHFSTKADGTLIAGDALATADMDKWSGALFKKPQQIARAGTPFICDWEKSRDSAQLLATLAPRVLACGHGVPMSGEHIAPQLKEFRRQFPDAVARTLRRGTGDY